MEYRFVTDEPSLGSIFHDALQADLQAAKLSRSYRAYYLVRAAIPLSVRQWLQHRRRVAVSNEWYLPIDFLQRLQAAVAKLPAKPVIHPWPNGARIALALTHDVETAEGVEHIEEIANLEEDLGFRSSWNFVPYKYRIDTGLLEDLVRRGFEIGVHGYNHDGKLFFSRSRFARRAAGINDALSRFQSVGFRAPMVHRNLEWLSMLKIEYDASFFDVDPYQAMPGGVGGTWPFIAGNRVELPYTLPQDHTLFVVRKEFDGRTWRQKLDYLRQCSGLALMLTHPDYMIQTRCRDVYREFLSNVLGQDDVWHALPKEVAAWWRVRDASTIRNRRTPSTRSKVPWDQEDVSPIFAKTVVCSNPVNRLTPICLDPPDVRRWDSTFVFPGYPGHQQDSCKLVLSRPGLR